MAHFNRRSVYAKEVCKASMTPVSWKEVVGHV